MLKRFYRDGSGECCTEGCRSEGSHAISCNSTSVTVCTNSDTILFHLIISFRGFDALTALQDVSLSAYGEAKDNLDWTRIARYVGIRLLYFLVLRF